MILPTVKRHKKILYPVLLLVIVAIAALAYLQIESSKDKSGTTSIKLSGANSLTDGKYRLPNGDSIIFDKFTVQLTDLRLRPCNSDLYSDSTVVVENPVSVDLLTEQTSYEGDIQLSDYPYCSLSYTTGSVGSNESVQLKGTYINKDGSTFTFDVFGTAAIGTSANVDIKDTTTTSLNLFVDPASILDRFDTNLLKDGQTEQLARDLGNASVGNLGAWTETKN